MRGGSSAAAASPSLRSGSAACRCRELYGTPTRRGDRHDPPRASSSGIDFLDTADVYGPGTTRSSSGARSAAGATRSCSPPSSASCATRGWQLAGRQRAAGVRARRVRGDPAAARRRYDRPLLPAPRRPEGADRGDGRRAGGARARRARCATSASRRPAPTDPPRAAVHPIAALQSEYSLWTRERRGARSSPPARARHRLRAVQPPRPRPARRQGQVDGGAVRRRLPALPLVVRRRQSAAQPPARRDAGDVGRAHGATPAQVAIAWLLHQGDVVVPIPGRRSARGSTRTPARSTSGCRRRGGAAGSHVRAGRRRRREHVGAGGEPRGGRRAARRPRRAGLSWSS